MTGLSRRTAATLDGSGGSDGQQLIGAAEQKAGER
jgi:hypothetical protein